MRVLLVQPDYKRKADSERDLKAGLLPARSLLELAAVLEERGHEAVVLDPLTALGVTGNDTSLDMVKALNAIMDKKKFDAVGIAIYTPLRKEAHDLAKAAKKKSRLSPVIVGGAHPTRLARSILSGWKEIDYVCMGAAEKSLPALLDSLSKKSGPAFKVRSIAFRAGPRFVRQTGKPAISVDLKKLPSPRYEAYLERVPEGKIRRAYVMTARGCKYWCNFCSNIWKKVLLADPEKVAEEISRLAGGCGAEQIIIYDDCFGMNAEHSKAVLEAIINSGAEVELQAITRFDLLDKDWLSLFKKAGGRDVLAGLETGSSRLRRKMNKHIRDDDLCRGAELLRETGLRLGVFLMFGFPGETARDVEDTYRLLEKMGPHQCMSSVFDIKPGDMLFEFGMNAEMYTEETWLDEKTRLINDMNPEELKLAAARAVAFDRAFTREVLLPEHDGAGFILGMDDDKLEKLIESEMGPEDDTEKGEDRI